MWNTCECLRGQCSSEINHSMFVSVICLILRHVLIGMYIFIKGACKIIFQLNCKSVHLKHFFLISMPKGFT